MQYRPFGRVAERVSALGFGAMRLPTVDGKVGEKESIAMIRASIEAALGHDGPCVRTLPG